jgi:CheY-like chemotaxis protein
MLLMDTKAGFLSPAANFLTLNPAEDYWMADRTKNQMLYVNPAYETIRGSTCESLYADLLMTDVLMPGMSGNELAEVLRASDAGLKVLFLSGHSGDTLARHGVVHTEVAFLQKPFTLNALSEKLMEVLDRT